MDCSTFISPIPVWCYWEGLTKVTKVQSWTQYIDIARASSTCKHEPQSISIDINGVGCRVLWRGREWSDVVGRAPSATKGYANGCIVVRPTSKLTVGMDNSHEPNAGKLELTTAYRYLYSDRHFRGSHEEKHRQREGTEVRNDVQTIDYTLTYWMNETWRFSASMPYIIAARSSLHDRANGIRRTVESEGFGDLRLMAYREMLDPSDGPMRGLTLGLGVKLPTGKDDVTDVFYTTEGPERRHVDQSIQLGDGGTGLIAEIQAYRELIGDSTFGFFTMSYLVNPEDTNGVPTHRRRLNESESSIPDTYQLRLGMTQILSRENGWTIDGAVRMEGDPSEDLVGDSNGFRRPGYEVYFEPSLSLQNGHHRASLSIPYAIERNRIRSVADKENGNHGDAAFADYLVMASYSYNW